MKHGLRAAAALQCHLMDWDQHLLDALAGDLLASFPAASRYVQRSRDIAYVGEVGLASELQGGPVPAWLMGLVQTYEPERVVEAVHHVGALVLDSAYRLGGNQALDELVRKAGRE